jgi:uncharacterized protein (TIRG00374 family)
MDKKRAVNLGKNLFRWGIAVVGIWWVISKMSWHDHVWAILPGQTVPTKNLVLADQHAEDSDAIFHVVVDGKVVDLPHDSVVNEPDRDKLIVHDGRETKYVIAVDLTPDLKQAKRLLVADKPSATSAEWVSPSEFPEYEVTVPHPRVQVGVDRLLHEARLLYFLAALAIFPLTILITSLRWHELLKALDINLPVTRTFVLNMVGMFWNTVMPLGSSGGDVFKAYYAAKQTKHHGTRAVMSVLVDRIIGLLALIILGGTMAALQWHIHRCQQVAEASAAILALVVVGMVVFYSPTLRRVLGLEFIINKLPMQRRVRNAIETMHILGRRPLLVACALIASFPVHAVVIMAAQMCGIAFGIHLSAFYYWMAVPVIVLAWALPISPQGAGVMEYFAILLLEPQGVTVAQAFALTMSIRLTQIFWNLAGGVFVVRGGFHQPTQTEQKEVEDDDEGLDEGETPRAIEKPNPEARIPNQIAIQND